MTLWPLTEYRPLRAGEWRLSVRTVSHRRIARIVERFPEGTVCRWFCLGLMVRLMVKHGN